MIKPNVQDGAGRLYAQLVDALQELDQARAAAAAGKDALRAVSLLRGLLDLVKESADRTAPDPHWRMAELILKSVPSTDSDGGPHQ